MLLSTLLAFLAAAPAAHTESAPRGHQDAPAPDRRVVVRDRYRALCEARDEAGLVDLWRTHEDLILVTIDADLEAGLAVWEEAPDDPDQESIDALHGRALFGARAASRATGRAIFHDYAASFVGWDADQRAALRVEQRIYQRALGELAKPDIDPSGAESIVAREVWERALVLGDWWGVAMGFEVEGRAHLRGGRHKDALVAFSQARLYFDQLGLVDSELETLRHLVRVTEALGTWERSRALAADALALARAHGRTEPLRELLQGRARAERALGRDEDAQRTAGELEALGAGESADEPK